jgi:hypothetical protein
MTTIEQYVTCTLNHYFCYCKYPKTRKGVANQPTENETCAKPKPGTKCRGTLSAKKLVLESKLPSKFIVMVTVLFRIIEYHSLSPRLMLYLEIVPKTRPYPKNIVDGVEGRREGKTRKLKDNFFMEVVNEYYM